MPAKGDRVTMDSCMTSRHPDPSRAPIPVRRRGVGIAGYRLPMMLALLITMVIVTMIATAFVSPARATEAPTTEAGAAPVITDDTPPGVLRWANRDIATFRQTVAGASPQERASRTARALDALGDEGRAGKVSVTKLRYNDADVTAVMVGNRLLFMLLDGDATEEGVSLDVESARVVRNLQEAFQAVAIQRQPTVIARGVGITVATTLLAAGLIWLVLRGSTLLQALLERLLLARNSRTTARFGEYLLPITIRIVLLLRWVLYLLVIYEWLAISLKAFPLTAPLGARLQDFFGDRLVDFARAFVAAAPGIATMALILFLTKAFAQAVSLFFDNIQSGRIRTELVHPDTASATKRLVNVVVWGIGVAAAYPYIPGSQTDAFKGLSVVFGLMLTLGSAGVVSQLMSGLVVVYSRALRRGDIVEVEGYEGCVVEVNALATKLMNVNRQEITIPNTVLVSKAIRNFSRLSTQGPVFLSVVVTIGYDAPWRLVQQLLVDAALATEGLAAKPEPMVLQRSLDDFYVRYELFASIADPRLNLPRRPLITSALNANIQDAFNAAGVQIMSPNFRAQPEQAVLVPKDQWFPPARESDDDAQAPA